MVLPAFKGVDAVAAVPGLCNPRGFVLIDEHQRSSQYPNIYSAGVCVAIPPVEATPVPTGAPKTGYMIESMVSGDQREHRRGARGPAGDGARRPGTPSAWPTSATPASPSWRCRRSRRATSPGPKTGKWVHLAKVAFEKYFLRKVRTGSVTPVYERYVLKALGIVSLKRTGS